MDFADLMAYLKAALKELWAHKTAALACGSAISFAILFIGITWPVNYETSATIYADNQNILKPLLEKQAEVSQVHDQVRVVRDSILSPRMLNMALEEAYGSDHFPTPAALEQKTLEIREKLITTALGGSYIKVALSGNSADDVYNLLNSMIDQFIRNSAEMKQAESREAYQFIDKQVRQYKGQLVIAEDRLKSFQSDNLDGTDTDVGARIASLRDAIENLRLTQGEINTRINSLKEQLAEENRFSNSTFKADIYRDRLVELVTRRDALLLTYKPTHPDVVNINLQIEDMKSAIRESQQKRTTSPVVLPSTGSGGTNINPLYQELRSKLADARVELFSNKRRLESTENLLKQEFERRKRIAEREAELLELKRDYNVTKKIYEDMLERRERARLSMSLNVEGQGITYKIQEPTQYPISPTGLTFAHFIIAGLIMGILAPLGFTVFYLMVDPRIRFVRQIEEISSVPILGTVPHTLTPLSRHIRQTDMFLIAGLGIALLSAYIGVAYSHAVGII